MSASPDPRANPLALGPLRTRADVARAVRDLHAPLVPHTSPGGARVRLGSFAAGFEQRVAELEGFARPLWGIVPLTVGGGTFDHWNRIVAGLDAGTDPGSTEYWGPVTGDVDQRMVEQAAIGVAMAFCPAQAWEPLAANARRRLVAWLRGIFEHEPAHNNWQFFRVLVALGLERVGAGFDRARVRESLERLESYRRGEHSYADGELGNVDYYVPFAFHTYGLIYAAANDLGLGDDRHAAAYRERAAGFAADFQHWFAPDGSAIPYGRSLTYRFAMAGFWGALAWANVESPVPWPLARGLLMRHLRWWAQRPISDRDGVLSVGFTYDNRRLAESYNSPGSPYWCMKAFTALAAGADHSFWQADEQPLPPLDAPVELADAGWVVTRDRHQAVALIARPAPAVDFPDQAAAKYRKFAYSSAFGFSADAPDLGGATFTDSTFAFVDAEGNRRVRFGIDAAGIEDGMAWSVWHPWPDVRVDTVCWAIDAKWHGRLHRIRTGRRLTGIETGFAIGYVPRGFGLDPSAGEYGPGRAVLATGHGCTALLGFRGGRDGSIRALAVNANLISPHTAVPALSAPFAPGDHRVGCLVFADPDAAAVPDDVPPLRTAAVQLLGRTSMRVL